MIETICNRIINNIQQTIVGMDQTIKLLLTAVLCEGHVLLEDVPGTGKTTLAKALSLSLGATFKRIQFTPDLLPSDVTGINWFNQKQQAFEYREGPIFSNIVLADEINRATPRTQSALLEAMQERQVTIDGETRMLRLPFFVVATQNPIELQGTFPLPEAQLDRFILRAPVGYPTQEDENEILERFKVGNILTNLKPVTTADEIIRLQIERQNIKVEASVRDYAVRIARTTRENPEIQLGASPRATMALYQASQAWAAIHGRDYVIPDDIKFLAPFVLCHRMLISAQAQLRGRTPERLVEDIVSSVAVPVEI